MRNPFDLQQNDAEFVAAARTKNSRQTQIARLSIARSWSLVMASLTGGFMLLMFALDWREFLENYQFLFWLVAPNLGSFLHLDLQVKFLKAFEADSE